MPNLPQKPIITVDGAFSDWVPSELITTPANFVQGYSLYGTAQNDTYFIAIDATAATDPAIGAGTTIWLNTDQNTATGYSPFGSVGADYNVTYVSGAFYLYTGAAAENLVSVTPLTAALSDGSLEIAIPRSLITPAGGTPPTNINIAGWINNGAVYLPGDYTNPEYTITDPATLQAKTATHRVAIVYSDTSANLYFNQTAYSDLFMAAQNQARMAGVSYDVIDESQLTNINNLIGYDAIIFPSMADVNTAQLPAIMSTLTSAVYNYHIGIITAGDFLTNDQTGAAFAGNAYANMQTLLGLERASGGNSGTVTATAADVTNPIMQGYTAGQVLQSYTNEGYTAYRGVGGTATDVLVNQNVTDVGTLPGVVQTTTGGTNVHFASTDLLGDSNMLSHAIQSVVLGTQPGVVLDTSRQAGIVALRMDMDQSQIPADVSPVDANGKPVPGIYDTLIPILQQWKQQYNFVGSYYIDIGDAPTAADPSTTNWAVSLPYYRALEAMGGEIGNHSYTHLINPPATTVAATTAAAAAAGSTQVTLATLPSINGVTVGMVVTGAGIGTNTIVTAVSGNTVTLSYIPGGYGTPNDGVLSAIPADTTLTFGIQTENTNFLSTTGTGPFTYDYEFNQSKLLEEQKLGTTIYGAAVPGATETYATSQNILAYYQSVAATATTNGYTGYVTGGWTGIGSGYPSAIGYMSPTSQGTVYIAPNMTFDFTEIGYQHKTIAQAEADWAAQFNALAANAAGTPVVVLPIHDYGVAAWNTDTNSGTGAPYTTQMYTDFIASAYAKNYEFLTLEELAARYNAQQKATINYTTTGNTIAATITPDPTAPDVGGMALNVVNGGTNVIQNVTNWYAYNKQEVFLPKNGGAFTINLGTTQDDLTHIASLPMRCDLVSCTGDGNNLGFSITGDGQVVVDLKNPTADIVSIQGAPTASLTGDLLTLTFADTLLLAQTYAPLQHTVSVEEAATEFSTAGNDIIIGTLGNDLLTSPGAGNDTIIGNGGTDTMMYAGKSTDYSIVTNADGSKTVTDLRAGSPDGTDTLIGIAAIKFAPGVSSIVASGTGITNGAGDVGLGGIVTLTVNFGEAMIVAGGAPTLTLNDGGVATYTGGSGTSALTFSYVVAAGQNTPDLVVSSFNLPTGVTVQNVVGTNFDPAAATNYNPTGILQIDTTRPSASVALVPTSDSGLSNTDSITKVTKPTFNGATEAGSTVVLFDGTSQIGTGIATATGQWSISIVAALANGTHNITATVTDVAGNVGVTPTPLSVIVDTVAPAAPTAPDLLAASDSGTSQTDNITRIATPIFSGSAEAGSTVTLFDGATAIGTGIAARGTWSITASNLTDGTHSITARATDMAGNVSSASGALLVTVDATAPAVTAQIASPADAILGLGATTTLTMNLSQVVTVSGGIPTLTLNNGGFATYASGSGTDVLTFNYTVAGAQDVSDLAVTKVNLNGAAVTDQAGTVADLSRAAVNPAGWLQIAPSAIAAFDTSTQQPVAVIASHYAGPVADLQGEYINITSDNLNVTASTPDWFIHSGSGMDAIAVSNGRNVLDGATGSNFLVGGNGTDTFFVDDRAAAADIWSTVAGFHTGDAATIWGVTPQDFNLTWANGQGAAGYTGLTLHAIAPSQPIASLTLAGYTDADLTNGRLTVLFGTDSASGSSYMNIHGNG